MATRSLNKVMLIGNLTRDPELRYTPQGTAVCTFGLATNRSWQPAGGGERQEEAEFHRIVCWQKLAELCSQLLFKGRKVFVEGRLQTRSWTSQDGQERSATEIVIDNMIILDSKRKEGTEMGGPAIAGAPAPVAQPTPVVQPTPAPAPVQEEPKKKKAKTTKDSKSAKEERKPVKEEKEVKEEVKADDIPF